MPIINGKETCPVEFTRVLHVPMLQNNLFAVLYLTRKCRFEVRINADTMNFILSDKTLFVASINDHNAAYLDGHTMIQTEFAKTTSTLPLDYML